MVKLATNDDGVFSLMHEKIYYRHPRWLYLGRPIYVRPTRDWANLEGLRQGLLDPAGQIIANTPPVYEAIYFAQEECYANNGLGDAPYTGMHPSVNHGKGLSVNGGLKTGEKPYDERLVSPSGIRWMMFSDYSAVKADSQISATLGNPLAGYASIEDVPYDVCTNPMHADAAKAMHYWQLSWAQDYTPPGAQLNSPSPNHIMDRCSESTVCLEDAIDGGSCQIFVDEIDSSLPPNTFQATACVPGSFEFVDIGNCRDVVEVDGSTSSMQSAVTTGLTGTECAALCTAVQAPNHCNGFAHPTSTGAADSTTTGDCRIYFGSETPVAWTDGVSGQFCFSFCYA
jgi:hypothetical protein